MSEQNSGSASMQYVVERRWPTVFSALRFYPSLQESNSASDNDNKVARCADVAGLLHCFYHIEKVNGYWVLVLSRPGLCEVARMRCPHADLRSDTCSSSYWNNVCHNVSVSVPLCFAETVQMFFHGQPASRLELCPNRP